VIPAFDGESGNLPSGVWEATWEEFEAHFGFTERRRGLLAGLRSALLELQAAGCGRAYIDGSFVTAKAEPNDFDGCWERAGVDLSRLDPILQDMAPPRAAQKAKYRGELFEVDSNVGGWRVEMLYFFQRDRRDRPKGIIAIELGMLT
jgi:hypothetical protein